MAEALHLREVVVVAQRPQLARWPQLAAWEHNRRLWSPLQRLLFDSANNESIANGDLLTQPAVGVRSQRCVAPPSSCSTSSERGVKKDLLKRTVSSLLSARGSPMMIEKRHRS